MNLMRKGLIVFIFCFIPMLAYGQYSGQEAKQKRVVEVRAGWGAESSFSWADNGGLCFMCCYDIDIMGPILDLDDIKPISHKYTTGPLWVGAALNITKRWDLGGSLIYDRFWQDYVEGKISGSYCSMQAMVRFNYVNRDWVRFYSSLSVGGHLVTHKEELSVLERKSELVPDMHFNCLGLSVGKTVFGFAEFGIGARGLISGGVGYRF
jgi:hypothetical protein